MQRLRAACLVLLASCYSPRAPEGAPCQSAQDCPSPQRCVVGSCSLREAPAVDAPLQPDAADIDAAVDAPIDAPPDALVLPCTATGLACGGATLTFMCGGRCWVRCNGDASWFTASQACTGWMGALGQINDAPEQSCVEMRVSDSTWIGLRQSETATAPALDWYWNTPANPVGYMHWQPGTPDDRDDRETRDEQCAKIQGDGTWDDVACSATTPFLCER